MINSFSRTVLLLNLFSLVFFFQGMPAHFLPMPVSSADTWNWPYSKIEPLHLEATVFLAPSNVDLDNVVLVNKSSAIYPIYPFASKIFVWRGIYPLRNVSLIDSRRDISNQLESRNYTYSLRVELQNITSKDITIVVAYYEEVRWYSIPSDNRSRIVHSSISANTIQLMELIVNRTDSEQFYLINDSREMGVAFDNFNETHFQTTFSYPFLLERN